VRANRTAHALRFAGVRPGSALLRDLASDPDPWGPVEVHCLYSRYDLMIVPPRSSVLRAARSTHELGVPLHRMMIDDGRVFDLVARALQ
jgi:triacylglycerol lipase